MFGAKKYARHAWRENTGEYSRLIDASYRHLDEVCEGRDIDPESGLPHAAHAIVNLCFLLEYQYRGLGVDDRFKPDQLVN